MRVTVVQSTLKVPPELMVIAPAPSPKEVARIEVNWPPLIVMGPLKVFDHHPSPGSRTTLPPPVLIKPLEPARTVLIVLVVPAAALIVALAPANVTKACGELGYKRLVSALKVMLLT